MEGSKRLGATQNPATNTSLDKATPNTDTKPGTLNGHKTESTGTDEKRPITGKNADTSNNPPHIEQRSITLQDNYSEKNASDENEATFDNTTEKKTEFNETPDLETTTVNSDINITSLADAHTQPLGAPAILSTVEKHSSLWVLFQKLKRFVRTIYMHKDSKNITSKDAKQIPENMIDCIRNLDANKTPSHKDNNAEDNTNVTMLLQYNTACVALKKVEAEILQTKKSDDKDSLEKLKLSKKEKQNDLLALSKAIVKYTDARIKYSENEIMESDPKVSKEAYANFFQVLKSKIGFDVNKIVETGKENQELPQSSPIGTLMASVKQKLSKDDHDLLTQYLRLYVAYQRINNACHPSLPGETNFPEIPPSAALVCHDLENVAFNVAESKNNNLPANGTNLKSLVNKYQKSHHAVEEAWKHNKLIDISEHYEKLMKSKNDIFFITETTLNELITAITELTQKAIPNENEHETFHKELALIR